MPDSTPNLPKESLYDRVGALEAALRPPGAPELALGNPHERLDALGERLERLEEGQDVLEKLLTPPGSDTPFSDPPVHFRIDLLGERLRELEERFPLDPWEPRPDTPADDLDIAGWRRIAREPPGLVADHTLSEVRRAFNAALDALECEHDRAEQAEADRNHWEGLRDSEARRRVQGEQPSKAATHATYGSVTVELPKDERDALLAMWYALASTDELTEDSLDLLGTPWKAREARAKADRAIRRIRGTA